MGSKRRKGCFFAGFFTLILLMSLGLAMLVVITSTPKQSPIALMFRTEADLKGLMTAVDTYHAQLGVYPPPGPAGLRLATDYLSRNMDYLPGGPPLDAWGHPFQYVPSYAYDQPSSVALKSDHGYYAPDSYQIYSPGMDDNAGLEETLKQRDNITSWETPRTASGLLSSFFQGLLGHEKDRTWRSMYWQRQRKYLLERRRGVKENPQAPATEP